MIKKNRVYEIKVSSVFELEISIAIQLFLENDSVLFIWILFLDFSKPTGLILPSNHPGAKLSEFSSPISDDYENSTKAAYAAIFTAKKLKNR